MEHMATFPDGYFDLAIVDPPYGLGDKLTNGGTWAAKYSNDDSKWDVKPSPEYFAELQRVAKNWIIWGANYFCDMLPPTRQVIVWHKPSMDGMHTMSNCEVAFTSFDRNSKKVSIPHPGDERIHMCQKPVALYNWLLGNFAEPGQRILDTHMGSGSIAIACHFSGYPLVAMEACPKHYAAAMERVERETRQLTLFSSQNVQVEGPAVAATPQTEKGN